MIIPDYTRSLCPEIFNPDLLLLSDKVCKDCFPSVNPISTAPLHLHNPDVFSEKQKVGRPLRAL